MIGSLRRVFLERRIVIIPLAVALLANAAIFALVVYPSSDRVARAEQREQGALQELATAQREFAAATRTQRDKARAEADLQKFYNEILPADLAGARRSTYLHLAQLAKDAGLEYQRRLEKTRDPGEGGQEAVPTLLSRFDITMVLEGDYEGVREFLRNVEASDGFIVIDNIGLAEGTERGANLVLTVELSTYYRVATRGS
jgi:Tfp pilus assembly protein PilO